MLKLNAVRRKFRPPWFFVKLVSNGKSEGHRSRPPRHATPLSGLLSPGMGHGLDIKTN